MYGTAETIFKPKILKADIANVSFLVRLSVILKTFLSKGVSNSPYASGIPAFYLMTGWSIGPALSLFYAIDVWLWCLPMDTVRASGEYCQNADQ